MKVCYLRAPARPEPVGLAWARALGAQPLELEELARRVAVANARREPLPYDVVFVDLVAEALPIISALARLLSSQPGCQLVLHAAHALPEDAQELDRFRVCLELSDLVICPTHALCADIRQKTAAPAHELAPPSALDASRWTQADDVGALGAAPDRGRRLTVVSARPCSHWRLIRELGVVVYTWTRIGGHMRWLDPAAPQAERERALSTSAFVYLPEPIDDAGALASDCARLGALLIAHLGYDAAQVSFPYTTFAGGPYDRRRLLFLWLYSSREFREFFRENALHGAVWLADENRRVQFQRRLEYQLPERVYRWPEGGPPSLLDQIRHRQGPTDVQCQARECALVCLVRNGREHIPAFLHHYRTLGVKHFFFIDNGSDDDTLARLEAQPDVTTYTTELPHKHYEREIRRLIIERHCRGSWCLNVDIDELFDYPRSDQLGLVGLLAYLSEHQFTAMTGYLLDMYAKENGFGAAGELDLQTLYPYYDISNVARADYFTDQVKAFCDRNVLSSARVPCYFGGIRKTLFGSKVGEDYLLTKHPLIFLDGRLEPVTHPHYSNQARVADITGVLYHYKFTPSFKAKVQESRTSQRYVKFAQGQYEQYDKRIGQRDSLAIDTPGTQRWRGVQQLVDQGFLMSSPAYEAHVRDASRSDAPSAGSAEPPSSGARAAGVASEPVQGGIDAITVSALLALLVMSLLTARAYWPSFGKAVGPSLPPIFGPLGALCDAALSTVGLLSLLVVAAAALHLADGLWRRRRPLALVFALLFIGAAFTPLGIGIVSFVCGVMVVANAFAYAYLGTKTLLRARRTPRSTPPLPLSRPAPRVSVVIPARDEEAVIEETLRTLDRIEYPRGSLEIKVIDDGSVDQTRARVQALALEMTHRVELVAHDRSAGKALRLNQLLPELRSEFVLLLDADHRVEPDILSRMLPHFAASGDVAGVQAASAVRNGDVNWITRVLEMEYLFRCQGTYPGKPMGIFVGSGGLFRRSALLNVGCFDSSMLTEDVELSYRLYASGQRIVYEPGACTFELATLDFRNFFNQRYRWMRGLWQSMLLHAPRAGRAAGLRRVLPYFLQCTSDGLAGLCLSVLAMYRLLEQLGWIGAHPRLPLYLILLGSSFAFGVGFLRAKRSGLIFFLPLVPLYAVLHSIPMAWALIDGYVLGKPSVWVKTERTRERPATIRLSRGGA
jgi:glycosyltransferase involved in cell wall biosynthesis